LPDALAAAVDASLDDDRRYELRREIAPAIARHWVGSPSAEVRLLAAKHPGVGARELAALARDPDVEVRRAVAARPETPADMLAILRKDPDEDVVREVKRNSNYKPGFFEKLFG
jgi:hypothetical protein